MAESSSTTGTAANDARGGSARPLPNPHDEVEFTIFTDPRTGKLSARNIKVLPKGTVVFEVPLRTEEEEEKRGTDGASSETAGASKPTRRIDQTTASERME